MRKIKKQDKEKGFAKPQSSPETTNSNLDAREPVERVNPFSEDSFERMAKLARGTKNKDIYKE